MRHLVSFSIIFTLLVVSAGGTSYFVNYETGVPGSGDGSASNPFALISESFSVLMDGDELILNGRHENGTDCALVFNANDVHLIGNENGTEASIACGHGTWHTLNLFVESISFEGVFVNTTGGDDFAFINCNFSNNHLPARSLYPVVYRYDKLEQGTYLFDGCVFSLYNSSHPFWAILDNNYDYQAATVFLSGFVNVTVVRSLVVGVEGPNRGIDFRNGAYVKVDQCEVTHTRHYEQNVMFTSLAFMNNSRVEITNSHFHDIEGTAIRFFETRDTILIQRCLFEDIRCNASGGAIDSVRNYPDLYYKFELLENTFRSVHSRDVGGAVRIYMIGISRDNYFLDCSSGSDAGSLATAGLIYRNIFENSYSGRNGGALFADSMGVGSHFPTPNVTDNVFYNSTALNRGGSILVIQTTSTIEYNHFIKSRAHQGGAVFSSVLYNGTSFQQNSFSQCEASAGLGIYFDALTTYAILRNSVLCPETPDDLDRYIFPPTASVNNNFNCRYYTPNLCKGNPPAGATSCIGGRWHYDPKSFELDDVPVVENPALLPGNVTISNGAELVISERLPTISVEGCLDLLGDLVVAIDSGELTLGDHSIVLFETTLGECLHVLTNTSGPDNSPFRVYERTQSCERVSGARASVSASRLSVLFTVNSCEGGGGGGDKKKKADSVLPIAVGVSVGVFVIVAIGVVVALLLLHRAGKLSLYHSKRVSREDQAL